VRDLSSAIEKAEAVQRDLQMKRYLVAQSHLNDLIALLKRLRDAKKEGIRV
jgi:hypothetical protein